MSKCKNLGPTGNKIFGIAIQIILIFIFLTVFFFTYVTLVEKEVFKQQINLIIDDLSEDFDINKILLKDDDATVSTHKQKLAFILLNGSLDLIKKNTIKELENTNKIIKLKNQQIFKKAMMWLFISIGLILVSIFVIMSLGYCLPLVLHFKNAFIIVLFVAITEFIFLLLITKNYWSVNRPEIRNLLSRKINDFLAHKCTENKVYTCDGSKYKDENYESSYQKCMMEIIDKCDANSCKAFGISDTTKDQFKYWTCK